MAAVVVVEMIEGDVDLMGLLREAKAERDTIDTIAVVEMVAANLTMISLRKNPQQELLVEQVDTVVDIVKILVEREEDLEAEAIISERLAFINCNDYYNYFIKNSF